MKKVLVAANWKMNPRTLAEARMLFSRITKRASLLKRVTAVLCVPSVFLHPLRQAYRGKKLFLGAQDVFYEASGPFTGEISTDMLLDAHAQYVIVGHSERRELGERNELIAQKLHAAIQNEIKTILCVGEHKRDDEGIYLAFIKEQIESALKGAPRRYAGNIIIAYEPLWAIGKDAASAVTPYDLHQSVLYIRKVLGEVLDDKLAHDIPVLYGGSVEPGNAEALLMEGEADGFLVGHASLNAESFGAILSIADRARRR